MTPPMRRRLLHLQPPLDVLDPCAFRWSLKAVQVLCGWGQLECNLSSGLAGNVTRCTIRCPEDLGRPRVCFRLRCCRRACYMLYVHRTWGEVADLYSVSSGSSAPILAFESRRERGDRMDEIPCMEEDRGCACRAVVMKPSGCVRLESNPCQSS